MLKRYETKEVIYKGTPGVAATLMTITALGAAPFCLLAAPIGAILGGLSGFGILAGAGVAAAITLATPTLIFSVGALGRASMNIIGGIYNIGFDLTQKSTRSTVSKVSNLTTHIESSDFKLSAQRSPNRANLREQFREAIQKARKKLHITKKRPPKPDNSI